MSFVCILLFCGTIVYTWGVFGLVIARGEDGCGFPFSNEAPLKVYFQQRVEVLPVPSNLSLDGSDSNIGGAGYEKANAGVKMTTHLTSVPYYLDQLLVPALPSARDSGEGVQCDGKGERMGLVTCVWESGVGMLPETGFWGLGQASELHIVRGEDAFKGIDLENTNDTTMEIPRNPWFSGNITRTSSSSVRFVLRGRNTRNCRIYLDNVHAVRYAVRQPGSAQNEEEMEGEMQVGYEVGADGVDEVRLWSRAWGKEWVVDVDFDFGGRMVREEEAKIKGRVACQWAEYESATVGVYGSEQGKGKGKSGKIPALEEVITFLPRWATVTKLTDGLVEVWSAFEN